MISIRRLVVITFLLLFRLSVVEAARNDVLVIVNDNSIDSPQVGAYYAEQRDIDPANIVHIRVPDSYFISWDDFRRLRDQLIRFMQANTLDDPALEPVVCTDGEPPYYCEAAMQQLRAHTRIRHLVTTRGVPTRMTVAGSTLASPGAPTSVDNYLKYWLINYFADDVPLKFTEREAAFGDGRGMRAVEPATDRELIVGRIDGLDLAAATARGDRTQAAERAGLHPYPGRGSSRPATRRPAAASHCGGAAWARSRCRRARCGRARTCWPWPSTAATSTRRRGHGSAGTPAAAGRRWG